MSLWRSLLTRRKAYPEVSPFQRIELKRGWNMVSLAVNPPDNSVSSVFADSQGSILGNGNVWWYTNGQYGVMDYVYAGQGYWVYSARKATLVIYGTRGTGIALTSGYNLVGPIYNVAKIGETYGDYFGSNKAITEISLVNTTTGGGVSYTALGPNDPMLVGKDYWVLCSEALTLPVFIRGD